MIACDSIEVTWGHSSLLCACVCVWSSEHQQLESDQLQLGLCVHGASNWGKWAYAGEGGMASERQAGLTGE